MINKIELQFETMGIKIKNEKHKREEKDRKCKFKELYFIIIVILSPTGSAKPMFCFRGFIEAHTL